MAQPQVKVEMTIDRVPELLADLQRLAETEVLVGIPEASAGRGPMTGSVGDKSLSSVAGGIANNNAQLGYLHEHGSPAANIPRRPWLVPGVTSTLPALESALRKAALAALQLPADRQGIAKALHTVGLLAQAGVRRYLTVAHLMPLKPSTLAARRRRGRRGTRPLLETGRLRQAIGFAIAHRGQRTFTAPIVGGGEFSKLIKGKEGDQQ